MVTLIPQLLFSHLNFFDFFRCIPICSTAACHCAAAVVVRVCQRHVEIFRPFFIRADAQVFRLEWMAVRHKKHKRDNRKYRCGFSVCGRAFVLFFVWLFDPMNKQGKFFSCQIQWKNYRGVTEQRTLIHIHTTTSNPGSPDSFVYSCQVSIDLAKYRVSNTQKYIAHIYTYGCIDVCVCEMPQD